MSDRYRSMLLFGSPGAGKGTQGKLLGAIPGMFHMATGDMFRGLDKTSPLGQKFVEYSSQGKLVPDELTVDLWKDYMSGRIADGAFDPDTDLLILDGIPRSSAQATMMDECLDVLGIVHMTAPDLDVMVERMKRRAVTEGRHDDADEDVIRHRFEVYQQETAPVLGHYDEALIHNVGAIGTPAEVLQRILMVVVPIHTESFANKLTV